MTCSGSLQFVFKDSCSLHSCRFWYVHGRKWAQDLLTLPSWSLLLNSISLKDEALLKISVSFCFKFDKRFFVKFVYLFCQTFDIKLFINIVLYIICSENPTLIPDFGDFFFFLFLYLRNSGFFLQRNSFCLNVLFCLSIFHFINFCSLLYILLTLVLLFFFQLV